MKHIKFMHAYIYTLFAVKENVSLLKITSKIKREIQMQVFQTFFFQFKVMHKKYEKSSQM